MGAASWGVTTSTIAAIVDSKIEEDTEFWGKYLTETDRYKIQYMESDNSMYNNPGVRLTMDYEEDFLFLTAVFTEIYLLGEIFSSEELMRLITIDKPEIQKINETAKAKYEEHLRCVYPEYFQ